MIKLDYIRGIEKLLKDRKINYRIIKKNYHVNNENKSSLFIIKKKNISKKRDLKFVDPLDLTKLKSCKKYFYSINNLRIYPKINNIKIFNNDTQLFLPSLKNIK